MFLWSYLQVKFLVHFLEWLQFTVVVVTSYIFVQNYPDSANIISDGHTFDFVIVGGGTAGCVMANRLTEVGNWTVLLIEAGDDPPYVTEIPGVSVLLGATSPDWNYYTVDDNYSSQAQKLRKIHAKQGKMLGGSSNVNYMYYLRGNRMDYENWVAKGNLGWDWNTVTKYFKKSENLTEQCLLNGNTGHLHGTNGYLGVTRPLWEDETTLYLNALKENGHDLLEDLNGIKQLGYSVPSYTISEQKRQSSALSYIKTIMKRENLFILKNTVATKVILDENKRAIGVELKANDIQKTVLARREIIISAGSINSPKLLMLSGIGPKEHLEDLDIQTQVNLPNVGANLQDHMLLPIILSSENGSTTFIDNFKPAIHLDKFPAASIMGFAALNKNQTAPDYQITAFPLPIGSLLSTLMCSKIFNWNDDVCYAITNSTNKETLFTLMSLFQPKSQGTIRLKSKEPNEGPIITSGYFSSDDDLKKFANCIRDFISVTETELSKQMKLDLVDLKIKQCQDEVYGSQEYWECYVLNLAASQYHYAGTCAMGPEGIGVVDERLRVRSVKGLRVVDASVMPTIVSGNTYAPVIMIAEKASDMIKTDNGIPNCNH